jgi:DNA-directed RNA polymerase subunit RPC12/RpoP
MRYYCFTCGKSVTSELHPDAIIRAVLVCPECIESKKIVIPELKEPRTAAGSLD